MAGSAISVGFPWMKEPRKIEFLEENAAGSAKCSFQAAAYVGWRDEGPNTLNWVGSADP